MHPINRALVHVEAHLADELSVKDIAAACGISPFHLSRVFAHATGYPVGRYVRLRRLSEAVRLLLAGDESVLTIALSVGYESHSVFTRAFQTEFGLSPSDLRRMGDAEGLALINPILWSAAMNVAVPNPRVESGLSLTMVGLHRRLSGDHQTQLAAAVDMVQRFNPRIPEIAHLCEPGYINYAHDFEDDAGEAYRYFIGMTVSDANSLPDGMESVSIDWARYLAFPFDIPVVNLRDFIIAIFADWFPQSDERPVDGSHIQWFKADPTCPDAEPCDTLDPNRRLQGEVWIPIA